VVVVFWSGVSVLEGKCLNLEQVIVGVAWAVGNGPAWVQVVTLMQTASKGGHLVQPPAERAFEEALGLMSLEAVG
jgi:hypothetical protein